MDASAYALVHGVRHTRATLDRWNERPLPVLRQWILGSLGAAVLLLGAVLVISGFVPGPSSVHLRKPPFDTGTNVDVLHILGRNALVLALHAMACVAGFIAGSSLPLQARDHTGVVRWLHEKGGPIAIAFVCAATAFSLSAQAYVLGASVAQVSYALHTSSLILLIALLPHALPELVALFLPLAAWIIASRQDRWEELLAATVVTVALAIPVLVVTALWEVYMAPHVMHALIAY